MNTVDDKPNTSDEDVPFSDYSHLFIRDLDTGKITPVDEFIETEISNKVVPPKLLQNKGRAYMRKTMCDADVATLVFNVVSAVGLRKASYFASTYPYAIVSTFPATFNCTDEEFCNLETHHGFSENLGFTSMKQSTVDPFWNEEITLKLSPEIFETK
eukprot:CAMPEP_0174269678 /NCGR_PEP_ID=MMETSP0439-20130205/41857_1 /TAXON_ID=0 /ORGANISM="Stereomyxa ramosa, Strain Chinc5" /LENGTH=156 /DNA_ID=CAMNT_0015358569 /DNA_START=38 /DNA_END=505 /DNA_ORIENTATION=-